MTSNLTEEEIRTFEAFCVIMRKKLEENAYKGGWGNDSKIRLLERTTEELDELSEEVKRPTQHNAVVYEAADVALMAMMTADVSTRERFHGNRIVYLASLIELDTTRQKSEEKQVNNQ